MRVWTAGCSSHGILHSVGCAGFGASPRYQRWMGWGARSKTCTRSYTTSFGHSTASRNRGSSWRQRGLLAGSALRRSFCALLARCHTATTTTGRRSPKTHAESPKKAFAGVGQEAHTSPRHRLVTKLIYSDDGHAQLSFNKCLTLK